MSNDEVEAPIAERELWHQGTDGRLSPRLLTGGRPFCAGILIEQDGNILATLSADNIAARDASGTDWFVGGVGGGQEPGEDLWECARREAREELGVGVELRSASVSYLHDIGDNSLHETRSVDEPAPFVLQRLKNSDPTKPFKPGNPAGHYTYLGLFLGRLNQADAVFRPNDDDIAALVWIPLKHWGVLADSPSWEQLATLGATIAAGGPIDAGARIHVSTNETLNVVAPLLVKHADVLRDQT
jgi:8-oxo-dGTP pyrophosphatase MutT (NUDIX family)